MKLTPLGPRAVVRRVTAAEKSKGGILIPETAKEKPQECIVVSVGEGSRPDSICSICARTLDITDRAARPLPFSAGDHVLVSRFAGIEITLDEIPCLVVSEDEILGVIKS